MKKRLWALPVSVVLTLGLLVTTPGAAAAADGWQAARNVSGGPTRYAECAEDGGPRFEAFGCFQPHGEWFWLIDEAPNGNPVAIWWDYLNMNTGRRRAGVIYDTHGEAAGWTNLNKSFAEGQSLLIKVCEANVPQRRLYDCGPWEPIRT